MTRPDDEGKLNEPQEIDWTPHSFADSCPPSQPWETLRAIPYEDVRLELLRFLSQSSTSEPVKNTFDPSDYQLGSILRLEREMQTVRENSLYDPTRTVFWGLVTEGMNSSGNSSPVLAFFGEDSLKTGRAGIPIGQRARQIKIDTVEHIRDLPTIDLLARYRNLQIYRGGKK